MAFISVYSKATGLKHRIPEHLLEVPSVASKFTKTPRQKSADERRAAKASEPVTNTEAAIVAEDQTRVTGEQKEK